MISDFHVPNFGSRNAGSKDSTNKLVSFLISAIRKAILPTSAVHKSEIENREYHKTLWKITIFPFSATRISKIRNPERNISLLKIIGLPGSEHWKSQSVKQTSTNLQKMDFRFLISESENRNQERQVGKQVKIYSESQ